MNLRVVRFTDVDPERLEERLSSAEEGSGPPEGVKATKVQIFVDAEQRTAIVLQHFDSEQDMADSEQAFAAMDPSETPGTRASVDRTRLVREFGS